MSHVIYVDFKKQQSFIEKEQDNFFLHDHRAAYPLPNYGNAITYTCAHDDLELIIGVIRELDTMSAELKSMAMALEQLLEEL